MQKISIRSFKILYVLHSHIYCKEDIIINLQYLLCVRTEYCYMLSWNIGDLYYFSYICFLLGHFVLMDATNFTSLSVSPQFCVIKEDFSISAMI